MKWHCTLQALDCVSVGRVKHSDDHLGLHKSFPSVFVCERCVDRPSISGKTTNGGQCSDGVPVSFFTVEDCFDAFSLHHSLVICQ